VGQAEQGGVLCSGRPSAHATLFGPFQFRTPDGEEIAIPNRRARALLAMLCLARNEPIDRDYLSKLFWPGRFEAHAKASLRQCLLDLGKLLTPCGADVLDITRGRISLRQALIETDLDAVRRAVRLGNREGCDRQLSVCTGHLVRRRAGDGGAAGVSASASARAGDAAGRRRHLKVLYVCVPARSIPSRTIQERLT